MRRLTSSLAAAILVVVVLVPSQVEGWGFDAHRFIMSRAIALLPSPIRPFFEAERATIVERAIDPDLWRTAGWPGEGERHFVDLDAYGAPPFKELPRDRDEAIKKFGKEFVEKNGTLPWRTEEYYGKLVEAFQMKSPYSRDNIRYFSSIVAHYVSDAHVPFHAALNYDGQLTQQTGIHARFESELFERYRARLRVVPKPVMPIVNARDFTFEALEGSFPLVQSILDADKRAVGNREVYDDGYFAMFFGRVRPTLETRLADSITAVASMITAAWIEAGRPSIPLQVPKTPRKVRRE
jgi:hypothetical protein